MEVFDWITTNRKNSLYIIFSPAGARQIRSGQPYNYPEPVKSGHYDHVHWSIKDKGGFLPPGWNMTYNGTGSPEVVLNADQFATVAGRRGDGALIGSLTVQVPERATARDVVDELSFALRHSRRGGVHGRRR